MRRRIGAGFETGTARNLGFRNHRIDFRAASSAAYVRECRKARGNAPQPAIHWRWKPLGGRDAVAGCPRPIAGRPYSLRAAGHVGVDSLAHSVESENTQLPDSLPSRPFAEPLGNSRSSGARSPRRLHEAKKRRGYQDRTRILVLLCDGPFAPHGAAQCQFRRDVSTRRLQKAQWRQFDMKPPFVSLRYKCNSTAAALALAAAVMLVPANLLPVLSTESSGSSSSNTIFSGTVELWHQGLWALALIVFTASILIPMLKLAGMGWLLLNTRKGIKGNPRRLTRIYAALDFIGRWSMLDVFLAAFLTGLVQFGEISTVTPRSGIVAFAAAVVLTVLSTRAFDPRSLWLAAPNPSP